MTMLSMLDLRQEAKDPSTIQVLLMKLQCRSRYKCIKKWLCSCSTSALTHQFLPSKFYFEVCVQAVCCQSESSLERASLLAV